MPGLTQLYYIFIMFFAAIGARFCYKFISKSKFCFFITMFMFGYCCMLLLSEAQSRYKSMCLPIICIISAFGIQYIDEIVSLKKAKKT